MKLNTNNLNSESFFKQLLDNLFNIISTDENNFEINNLYFYCFYFDAKKQTIMP